MVGIIIVVAYTSVLTTTFHSLCWCTSCINSLHNAICTAEVGLTPQGQYILANSINVLTLLYAVLQVMYIAHLKKNNHSRVVQNHFFTYSLSYMYNVCPNNCLTLL